MRHISGWCRIVVTVNLPMRVDARSYLERFGTRNIASIIDDSRCGMSDVAFRIAPIGRFYCVFLCVFDVDMEMRLR